MAKESSFDVVSRADINEVRNAVNICLLYTSDAADE